MDFSNNSGVTITNILFAGRRAFPTVRLNSWINIAFLCCDAPANFLIRRYLS